MTNPLELKVEVIVNQSEDWVALSKLNEADIEVCKTICPRVQSVEDFTDPLPATVFKQLETVKKQFDAIQVWSAAKDPDPFLVGLNKSYYIFSSSLPNKFKHWGGKTVTTQQRSELIEQGLLEKHLGYATITGTYLLARWGKELLPFEQLRLRAKQIYTKSTRYDLLKEKAELESKLTLLELEADNKFGILI